MKKTKIQNKKQVKKHKKFNPKLIRLGLSVLTIVLVSCLSVAAKYEVDQARISKAVNTLGFGDQSKVTKLDQASHKNTNDTGPQKSETPPEAKVQEPPKPTTTQQPEQKQTSPPAQTPTTQTPQAQQPAVVATTPPPTPPPAPPASATTLETASSLSYINNLRATLGKPPLNQNGTMNSWALAHAQTLAGQCTLFHQSLSGFLGRNIGPVTVMSIAENVGYASTTPLVLEALKNSPGHYANMTGDYSYVGIGVVTAGGGCAGYVYTTQMFAK